MATVVGVFSKREQAEEAVRALENEGFSEKEISIAAKDDRAERQGGRGRGEQGYGFEVGNMAGENVADGATWGGAIGGAAGLLASAGALAIPGIGPILAAGPLAATLSGAVAGGVAGGLIDMGIPENEGRRYEQDVKEGKVLCMVQADAEQARRAESILKSQGADEVKVHGG